MGDSNDDMEALSGFIEDDLESLILDEEIEMLKDEVETLRSELKYLKLSVRNLRDVVFEMKKQGKVK